ncbi:hypothetical protein [Paraflavitalea sp. CAU 1676]|uniref:hypothetical protein n=1 Tax=Paraflavitalea sp. CAU 1676 TaxID=3032598 RepID=UPI0023DBAD75|nr:hypothetical protein [Paraflavitalea sp. CAU 1676]MDF2189268.1 hypothetical protein [Paraflavitalea sp. CAU 1676]
MNKIIEPQKDQIVLYFLQRKDEAGKSVTEEHHVTVKAARGLTVDVEFTWVNPDAEERITRKDVPHKSEAAAGADHWDWSPILKH